MGRPKGSKNKPKVAAKIVKPIKAPPPVAQVPVVAVTVMEPPLPGAPLATIEEVEQAYNAAMVDAGKQIAHYRVKQIAPHTEIKLKRILTAKDRVTLQKYVDKATDSVFLWCLAEWAKGNSPGPKAALNQYSALQEAGKAEKLAAFLLKRGQPENAASQRVRAAELREQARELGKAPT